MKSVFDFYARSNHSYAILITGEEALYGNIILKKRCNSPRGRGIAAPSNGPPG
ncbi:RbsD/FucU domain-containing protein [Paenibacillus rhizoplanae]